MMDLKTASPQEIVSYFSHAVNNLLLKPDKIAEEQWDSSQMKDLDICWIKVISDSGYRTDLRNEASAKTGRQLAEIPFVQKKMESVSNEKMEKVVKEMAIDHRTLQQTFSGLVFFHFLQFCDKEESEKLIAVMGEPFYRLPLF